VNRALCRILGYPVDELLPNRSATLPIRTILRRSCQVRAYAQGKIDSYEVEKRDLRKDGRDHLGQEDCGCVRKGDGSIDFLSV